MPFLAATLIVGVTGHRNLREADVPALRAQIHDFFMGLRTRYPGLPISVLSSLAEGSDQLVADVALDLGFRVVAPLALPPGLLRHDFTSDVARRRFDEQLRQVEVLTLPPAEHAAYTDNQDAARNLQYAQAGIFVSSHCHILLALWDGNPSELVGGTAQVVDFHLRGDMPVPIERRRAALGLLGLGEETLVHHIPVNRVDGVDGQAASKPRWLTCNQQIEAHASMPMAFDRMCRRHCEFNEDWVKYGDRIGSYPDTLRVPTLRCPIHALFEVADWLARTYQRRIARVLLVTYVLAALMGFSFVLYADVTNQDAMLYLFLLFFAGGIVVNWIATRREWHRQYIDYRALAEGLRVQSFWRRAGIVDSSTPAFAHDNFLQKQDIELGWIRNVMRGASLDGILAPLESGPQQVAEVIDEWIGTENASGQLAYYGRTASRRTRLHRRDTLIADTCLWIGIGISVVLALSAHRIDGALQNLLVATMGLLSVAVAVHEAYAYKKADKELIKQYRFMQQIFAAARQRLALCGSVFAQRQVLSVLGEAALAEHAEWTLMHRERPLQSSKI